MTGLSRSLKICRQLSGSDPWIPDPILVVFMLRRNDAGLAMYGPLSEQLFNESREEIYNFREIPFRLSSGGESQHYFNCRKITLHPRRLIMLARCIRDELLPAEGISSPQAVGGLTMGADPIILALALAFEEVGQTVYPLIVRKKAKGHGMGMQIEGEWQRVSNVLAVDDVITTGGSTLKAVQILRETGLNVERAICVVDRQEGGRENLAARGITLHSVFTKGDYAIR